MELTVMASTTRRPIYEIQSDLLVYQQQITEMRNGLRRLAGEIEQYREIHEWIRFDSMTIEKIQDAPPGSVPVSFLLHGWIQLIESEDLADLEQELKRMCGERFAKPGDHADDHD